MPGTENNFVSFDSANDGIDSRCFVAAVIVNGNGNVTFQDNSGDTLFTLEADGNQSTIYYLNCTFVDGIVVESITDVSGYIQVK